MRREAYIIGVSLLVAMAAGSVLILIVGQSPAAVYAQLLAGTWGSRYDIGQVLFESTPLVFTGLAVALAFRAGLFNIGGEGQMTIGAFATALVGAYLPASTPAVAAIPAALLAGMLAGAGLAAIAGALRAYTGAHEVINTIMLNFIASAVVLWAGNRFFFMSATTHTAQVVAGARLPGLGLAGSAANLSVALAAIAAGGVWYFLARTRRGYELRATGLSPAAAENAGVNIRRVIIGSMAASGALAGLVGSDYVLGYKHYFENGMGHGMGFMGIAVALLGRNDPVGVVAAALLFGTLSHGAVAVSSRVPKSIVEVLDAVIILAVAATSAEVRRRWPARPARGGER